MKKNRKLPIFPEEVNKIGRTQFLTKNHIRAYILREHPDLAEEFCIFRRFNPDTGELDKKYAWSTIIDIMNKDGRSEILISKLLWT
jgi:hypothetical protein